ncbi:glycosyltransferase family 2 protein [Tepidicaulis sp.]|uniref:glycosyltransferase family 2 protein n=1 Tax=Tepidicaulis sp. TaxID=1920809 RepID=UPI003B59B22D
MPELASLMQTLQATLTPYFPWMVTLSWAILFSSAAQIAVYIIQLPAAWAELRRYSQVGDTESEWQLLVSDAVLPITLILPAYNEEAVIVESTRSMLGLEYPQSEVIVVNDGSKDRTLDVLKEAFDLEPIERAYNPSVPHAPIRCLYGSPLYPNLLVIDKENGGGKADAMNAGVDLSRCPLFCVVDADSLLEAAALLRGVRPFMEEPERTIAVGGTIRIANGCEVVGGRVMHAGLPDKFLPLVQTLEYIRAFLVARLALSRWGILTIISGAFGIFRRDVVVEVGAFSHDTVGEDFDLIVKLHRHMRSQNKTYDMKYVPEPVCWTEAPETRKVLKAQRKRWQRGALEVLFKNRDMLFNPAYGRIGMLGLPYAFIVDFAGPIFQVLGYLLLPVFFLLGAIHLPFLLAYMALVILCGIFVSLSSLCLEEMELQRTEGTGGLLKLMGVAVIENLGYRQLNNFWRMAGWWEFLRKKQGWGEMTRKGFATKANASTKDLG